MDHTVCSTECLSPRHLYRFAKLCITMDNTCCCICSESLLVRIYSEHKTFNYTLQKSYRRDIEAMPYNS